MKRNSKPQRLDPKFLKELDEIASQRASKGDRIKELSYRELTRMSVNTVSWKKLKEELATKPRRK